jgi:hypothetical protein
MLKNNLAGSIYDAEKIPTQFTALRAQQMSISDLRAVWDVVKI